MKLRTKISGVLFAVSSISAGLLLAAQTDAARVRLTLKLEGRAEALCEAVADGGREALRGADARLASRIVERIAGLPSVRRAAIFGPDGREFAAAGAVPDEHAHRWVTAEAPIGDSPRVGSARVVLSTEVVEAAVQAILWRGAALACLSIVLIAGVSWWIGWMIGRRLEDLVGAVRAMETESGPLPFPGWKEDDEIGHLASAFRRLGRDLATERERLRTVEALRKDLAAMIVHDLKSPLTIVKLSLGAMRDSDPNDGGSAGALLAPAYRSVERMEGMVEDILRVARLSEGEVPLDRIRISVSRLVGELAEDGRALVESAGRRWSVFIAKEARERLLFGDLGLLRRVVMNLLQNAVENTERGDSISFGARAAQGEPDFVELVVRDSGRGVPERIRGRIFRKFASYESEALNVGLGLAFCKLVIDRHKGRISVSDARGGGAEFSVRLPSTSVEAEEGPPREYRYRSSEASDARSG